MDPICTGTMKYLGPSLEGKKQEWNKRFFVLFPQTPTSKARLDWYQSKSDYLKEPLVRKTIFIEEITSISHNNSVGKQNQFELMTLRKQAPYCFYVDSKKELEKWLNNLQKLRQECKKDMSAATPKGGESCLGAGLYCNELWSFDEMPEEFPVTVGETDSAVACKLTNRPLILQIYAQCLVLKEKKTGDVLYIWPYMYIRRYGKNNQSFTFEAGRGCASGQGVFILLSPESEEIFKLIHTAAKRISSRPPLPSKQYSHDGSEPPPQYDTIQPDGPKYSHCGKSKNKPSTAPKKQQPTPSAKPGAKMPTAAKLSDEQNYLQCAKPANKPCIAPKKQQHNLSTKQPTAPKPSNRVPVVGDYSEPLMGQSPRSDYDQAYSSVDKVRNVSLTTKDQAVKNNDYAEPVQQGGASMSSIAMQINVHQISSLEDQQYDEVNLNGLRLASKPANDEDTAYGALYSEP